MRWADPGDAEYAMGRPCYRTEHYVRAAEEMAEMYGATVVRKDKEGGWEDEWGGSVAIRLKVRLTI